MSTTATGEATDPASKPGALRALWLRIRHIVHELGKFGVVGGVSFAVDSTVFYLARQDLQLESLTAKTISTVVAATVAFVGNRFWTWRHRERSGMAREYLLYFFFNAVGLGIGLLCLGISHYGLGNVWPVFKGFAADYVAGTLVGTAFGTLFRFWAYRRFVFVAPAPAEETIAGTPVWEVSGPSGSRVTAVPRVHSVKTKGN